MNALNAFYELAKLPRGEFLGNGHYVSSAKHDLLVIIDAYIDIAYHLISKTVRGFQRVMPTLSEFLRRTESSTRG